MHAFTIFPSLISADVLNLQKVITLLEPHCDGFHIDVMDYHFVPNLTWGPHVINAIARATTKPLVVHLMIEQPDRFIHLLTLRPHDTISFHIESTKKISETINSIKEMNLGVSIAIKPKTPLEQLYSYVGTVDQILLMSVEPGFSGQRFLPDSIERLKQLTAYRKEKNLPFTISMDGGITQENIDILARNGCNQVGVASAIFDTSDPIQALKALYGKARSLNFK